MIPFHEGQTEWSGAGHVLGVDSGTNLYRSF